MKKSLSLVIAAFAVFAMTAVSFAANTANINVTSEPIQFQAECDKAGGLTLTFDDNTIFASGDQITADLPLNVTLCTSFDFIIGIGRANGDPLRYTTAFTVPPIGTDGMGPITGDGSLTGSGVAFHVIGNAGSARVTINVVGDVGGDGTLDTVVGDTLTFTAHADTNGQGKLAIEFLDQATYSSTGSGMFSDQDAETWYDDQTPASENTLCINVSEYNNETVNLSWDSAADKYTWIPSNPQVAHVVAPTAIALANCSKQECGNILDFDAGVQNNDFVDECNIIDNEANYKTGSNYAYTSDGYCSSTHRDNRIVIQNTSGAAFDTADTNYQIQLEILVNGVGGDQGVYFDGAIGSDGYETQTEACDAGNPADIATTYYNALNESSVFQADASATNGDIAPSGSDIDCDIDADNRIVKVKTTAAGNLGLNGSSDDFLFVDMPNLVWDKTLFTAGDVLEVKITLLKAPCGVIFQDTLCIGTLGCEPVEETCSEYTGTFPYMADDGAYTSIMTITNTASSAISLVFNIYEADGDIWQATGNVGANSIVPFLLWNLTPTAVIGSTGDGVFGSSSAYVMVTSQYSTFFGTAFVTRNDNGESMSYRIDDPTSSYVDCPTP